MDPIQIYACSLGGIALILLTFRVMKALSFHGPYWPVWLVRIVRYISRKIMFLLLKHVLYPRVFHQRSRYWVLLQSIYWGGTITCNFIRTHTLQHMAARAGNLAVLNFIPLLLAGRLDLVADLLGIPIRSYIRVHGTFGLMACVQAVVHVIISVRERGWSPDQLLQLYGLIAISAFALSVILIFIRRFVYEVFIKSHYLLAVLALFAIWRHVRFQRNFAQLYMLVGSGLLITTTTLHWIILIIRNITLDRFGSRAMVSRGRDSQVAQVVIPINRPFTVHAGMTVRIWMPGVSLFSWLYSHPFTISWWETDKEGKATSITLLIQKKHGFTKSLIDHPGKEFITWVDGPYGTLYNMAQYDNVLMVASGVGIIAQILYIRQFLDF